MQEREHPLYKSRNALWDFFLLSYKGGDPYCHAPMLYGHTHEEKEDYLLRQERSYFLNYTRPVVDAYTKHVCGMPLSRVAIDKGSEDLFESFEANCNGKGTKLSTFIRVLCTLASIFGRCGVLVLGSDPAKTPVVKTAVADRTLLPRLRLVKPKTLIDWSKDSDGRLLWILLRYTTMIDTDYSTERRTEKRFELWTPDEQVIYREDKDSKNLSIIEREKHSFGRVPYVEFVHADVDMDDEPESLIEDISIINRTIYNYSSLLDEILYLQAFSQLVIPADEGEMDKKTISTHRAFRYSKEAPYPPSFISPDASQARLFAEMIQTLIAEIYRIAVLRKSGAATTDQYQTAFGKMVDFEDTEAVLISKAQSMETSELALSREVGKFMKLPNGLWTPNYPRTFEVRSFAQEIADALSLESLMMGPTFMSEIKKKLSRRALPQASSEVQRLIESEILEAPTPISDPDPNNIDSRSKKASVDDPPNAGTTK
jgi:hypothetical protein